MDERARRLLEELRADIRDERVLRAVAEVPRDLFVPAAVRHDAWRNMPLPIGEGQTISQPLVVARMLELLAPGPQDRVLDVGTGSGYHAALLARLSAHVWSIEVHPELSARAAAALAAVAGENVTPLVGYVEDLAVAPSAIQHIAELVALADRAIPAGSRPRAAIVAPADVAFGMARMYQARRESQDTPRQYFVCRTMAEARGWLGLTED